MLLDKRASPAISYKHRFLCSVPGLSQLLHGDVRMDCFQGRPRYVVGDAVPTARRGHVPAGGQSPHPGNSHAAGQWCSGLPWAAGGVVLPWAAVGVVGSCGCCGQLWVLWAAVGVVLPWAAVGVVGSCGCCGQLWVLWAAVGVGQPWAVVGVGQL